MKLQMEPRHWHIVSTILKRYPYTFYAFGSRVKQTAREFSDLDLGYYEPIPLAELAQLEAEFADSDLPFTVDVVDLAHVSAEFMQQINPDLIKLTGS